MKQIFILFTFTVLISLGVTSAYSQGSRTIADKTAALQGGKISGRVSDSKNKPVAYATVTLLRTDSTVVNGDLTKEDGSFAIAPTGTGQFILRINAIGFNVKFVENIALTADASEKSVGKITVSINSKVLSQVEVTGERSMMEMSVDKKVFNVEKDITTTGGSASDVLKNVPSLAVDVDGDILLRGKETTLLIDGKPATLLGGDIASALQSVPASAIQSVEVITNPSARFDAQGMAGIINIITKKDSRFGLNGSASIGAGTGDKYNGALNLNMRNNKWNIFFNSSLKLNRNYQRNTSTTFGDDSRVRAESFEDNIRKFNGFFNTIGAEYTFNANSTLSFTQNVNKMQWGGNGVTKSWYYDDSTGVFIKALQRTNDNLGGPLSTSSSLDFKHKFRKPKQELSANATFAKTWVEREQSYTSQAMDKQGNLTGSQTFQNAPGGGSTASLNAQADLTTPFLTKTGKLDAGVKTQLTWFESSNNATINNDQPDNTLQNNYNYDQQVHAAYASYNDQKGKFTYQAGLRLEYSRYSGASGRDPANKVDYTNDFLGLFPSAYLSYKLSKQQDVYLSYTRRTNRPGFFQLMPYVDVSNPQDTSMGNPDLIPEFIHNTELSYSRQFEKGHQLIFSAYYQYTQNLIERVKTVYADGTSFTKPQNLANGATYGAELTGKATILPIWDLTGNLNFFNNQIQTGNIEGLSDNSGSSFFAKLSSNVRMPYGLSLQVNGGYDAPKVSAQGTVQEVWYMDAAVRKNLLKNKATLVLNVSDLFNTRKYTTNYDFPGYSQTTCRDRETRVANITFTYRFGRSDAKTSRRRAQTGQVPVKDRDNLKQGDEGDAGGF